MHCSKPTDGGLAFLPEQEVFWKLWILCTARDWNVSVSAVSVPCLPLLEASQLRVWRGCLSARWSLQSNLKNCTDLGSRLTSGLSEVKGTARPGKMLGLHRS